ncbi:MAG: PfkB family carbohydrate kinase [Dysgonomonas sp.]|jgi:sugar/nucleoside kinase (ribokinase family)|uniref:PfkB family carbohydrate kinase n=1 Tax=unclassified Dysgonomonas TaxID=2630389 RepID=UPI0025BF7925|nr:MULTISPECIES: PfkB family carbohydrate kinase [unclassified Dysgonomonas]MDR1716542.1 PfkB family carbohydrate kinase [Prevotella sp.]MDR2002276.1 PfkB family carbohydrate kinase [Prevotella sp.]HMM02181.1 PfkB family carbohydrate kinase [Dysgonomonas sp.]
MQKHDLCCVGHITLDKVVTPKKTVHMPGGTAFYFSHAIRHFDDIDYSLVTSLAESEMSVVDDLRSKNVDVHVIPSQHSVYFENIYEENQNNRTQRVLAKADPFSVDGFENLDAKIFLLGALLADDFSLELVEYLSRKGLIAVDSQGYLREVREQNVYPIDWKDKLETLKYVHILKVNDLEMEVLTGMKDIKQASRQLYDWGVKEVLVTLGSLGSVIYDGKEFYKIPAYKPSEVVDATGCGDTYVTGYLYKRAKGAGIEEAGKFAAAMATIKIENSGPFNGTKEDVENRIRTAEQIIPVV